MQDRHQFEKTVLELLEPVGKTHGYEIVDVDWTNDAGKSVLRVYIDKDGGVDVDDCSKLSGYFEDVLDMEDALSGKYQFEVSSPGLNRPLRTKPHYEKALGQKVHIVTHEKIDGRKNYKGILKAAEEAHVVVEIDNQEFQVPLAQIAKAHIVYQF